MSIKCLTVVLDENGQEVCIFSVSMNGQVTGHGQELKQLLRGYKIIHDMRIKDRRATAVSLRHPSSFQEHYRNEPTPVPEADPPAGSPPPYARVRPGRCECGLPCGV